MSDWRVLVVLEARANVWQIRNYSVIGDLDEVLDRGWTTCGNHNR